MGFRGLIITLFALSASTLFAKARVTPEFVILKSDNYRFENQPQERTQPIPIGEIVYYASLSGDVKAIHRTLGYTIWKTKLKAGVDGALTYGRAKLFVGDVEGNFYALRARDGSIKWTKKVRAEWLSKPVLWKDKVIAATSDNSVYAYDEDTGDELWFYPRKGDEKMTIRGISNPVVYKNEVYQGFSDGSLVALRADTGQEIWRKRLAKRNRFYDVDTTPYVDEQSVVAGSYDGSIYKMSRLDGNLKWAFQVGSYGGFLVEPKEKGEGSQLYFSGLNKKFYALDYTSGTAIWQTSHEDGVGLTPQRVGDYLVITTSSDPVYVLDPKDGKIQWKGSLGEGTLAPAAADPDGWFFCLSNYGNLYGFLVRKYFSELKTQSTVPLPSAIHRGKS